MIGNVNPTISDLIKRLDPKNKIARIVEILKMTNEILDDMTWIEGNLPTGHMTTVRSGLPAVAWRLLNYGVQPSKSRTVQVTDSCGMLEAYAEVDKDLADLNGNTSEFRLSEDMAFLEAMNQEMAETVFYGNTNTDPQKFLGLTPRFSDPSAENGVNMYHAGGDTAAGNTSIWLVVWGPNTVHGIIPKGSVAGVKHENMGQKTLTDANGGQFEGYRSHYKWNAGLTVRDWRYIVRICNIKVAALTKDAASGADLVDLMSDAIEVPPNLSMGRAAWYCNKKIRSFLRRQIRNANNVFISMEEVAGKKVVAFDGIPVRKCDSIINEEALVVGTFENGGVAAVA